MSPIRVTAARTFGRARNMLSTAFAAAGFMSVSSLFFAFRLSSDEGGVLSLPVLWASCVALVMPAFAAFLAMDVWSEERLTGRIDSLLSLAVRERDFVFGKFIGVMALIAVFVGLHLAASVVMLLFFAPQALVGAGCGEFLMALLAVLLQAMLWSATTVALSAMFRHVATVACAALVLTIAIPRGIWKGLEIWSSSGRQIFGEFPLDAHVIDIASGIVPVGVVVGYFVASVLALFLASKSVAATRLTGRGALGLRLSTGMTMALAVAVAALAMPLLQKMNPVIEVPVAGVVPLSQRTRSILTESSGSITITCFLSRNDVRFRPTGRMLRRLQRESGAVGGARIELRFVDPRWDIGAAERLVRKGVAKESLVFEKKRRIAVLAFGEGLGERTCASAIRQISSPFQRRNIYWTIGHGEFSYDVYDAFGMSDIARELFREGYRNEKIDLAAVQQIPGDCALVLVAGAKDDFSRVEIGRLEAYLKDGGRLLVLQGSAASGGVVSMLPSWGLRPSEALLKDVKSLSSTDVIVSEFMDHPISSRLSGSRIVMERPVAFAPSAVIGTGAGVSDIEFRPVAKAGGAVLVAATERGGGVGKDIALRPTRIVAVGDASFALNGALSARACANCDFFSNCVAYLSGVEAHGSGEDGLGGDFRTGMDRRGRLHHALASVAGLPLLVFLVLAAVVVRRRRRI